MGREEGLDEAGKSGKGTKGEIGIVGSVMEVGEMTIVAVESDWGRVGVGEVVVDWVYCRYSYRNRWLDWWGVWSN